ncbi:MAG: PepSY-like domain-containing protein [Lishizhenia sp.]
MKKSILTVALLLGFAIMTRAQDAPKKVTDAFNAKFKNAEYVEWELEDNAEWGAEFEIDGKVFEARFSKEGIWKETAYEIEEIALPKAVKTTLSTKYPKHEIYTSRVVELQDSKSYKFELGNDSEMVMLSMDETGKILKTEVEKFEEEDY